MAYTKTTWQNNVTDIDANNLNKIEQGIYDNSLVVDAVTNTLNPTDTETYKTAELTEGQIIDVIGVSDILIKGQTSQNGEPTPSSPVDVNVVSGSNVVNTSNKNLLKLTNYLTQTVNGVTLTFKNGAIICNGTATANVIVNLLESNLTLLSGAYALSGCPSGGGISSNYKLDIFKVNTSSQLAYDIGNGTTFTLSEQTTFDRVRLVIFSGKTVNNLVFKPQLEISSTVTTYEPHQGKELPLDLPVENLFDGAFNQGGLDLGSTGASTSSGDRINTNFISVQPSTTYTISNHNSNIYQFGLGLYKSDETYDSAHKINNGAWINFPYTFTTQSDTYYIRIAFKNSSSTAISPTGNYKIMVSKGILANAYTPYGTDPIELCKIANYQDYFYKSGSKWYLHKEIGKVVLNGTESWTADSNGQRAYSSVIADNVLRPANDIVLIGLCDKLQVLNFTDVYINKREGLSSSSSGTLSLHITGVTDITFNENDFKTWLSSNNITLYYALATATNTEITDTNLISQLETIYNAPLYEQTNITQTNNDLPMVLDITACKDNINGIKAFIRK